MRLEGEARIPQPKGDALLTAQLELVLEPRPETRSEEMTFTVAFLALAALPGIGRKGLMALVKAFGGNLGRVWLEDPSKVEEILRRARVPQSQALVARMFRESARWIEQSQKEADRLCKQGIQLLSSEELPPAIRELDDAPGWLFVQGNPETLTQKPVIAVVGTRKPTEKGKRAAEIVAEILSAYPIVLVSGLADGIDAVAHKVSLREGVPNVAFLGHGIRLIFPQATASIRKRIVEQGGAVATEYLPDERYDRGKFVARNRLQAALADLVIPVEGRPEGGTAHTVRFAHRYGREILGLRWEGADGLFRKLALMEVELVDPFTRQGRRRLDERLRVLAEAAGHATNALSRVVRLLNKEEAQRHLRPEDLLELQEHIRRISTQQGSTDTPEARRHGCESDSL